MKSLTQSLRSLILAAFGTCCAGDLRGRGAVDGSCELARQVEAATLDSDPNIRREAVYLLGRRSQVASMQVVGALVGDPEEGVRLSAIEAVMSLNTRGGNCTQLAAQILSSALRDKSELNRRQALCGLASCRGLSAEQVAAIHACLDDTAPIVRIEAVATLAHLGLEEGLEKRAVELIDKNAGGSLDLTLASLLNIIHNPDNIISIDRLINSENAKARYQAVCAEARLKGDKERWKDLTQVETEWHEEYRNAQRELLQGSWERVPRSEVLQRVRAARLVLFGELHVWDGPIRANEKEVLRAFVKEPRFEAVGYEPSAESSQRELLNLAESLGMTLVPLETNWRDLGDSGRWGARECEAIGAIEAFLADNPAHRMMVIRGEAHVLPAGYLVRRLSQQPLILLSGITAPVPLCEGDLLCDGTTFELAMKSNVYVLPSDDDGTLEELVDLSRWMAAH